MVSCAPSQGLDSAKSIPLLTAICITRKQKFITCTSIRPAALIRGNVRSSGRTVFDDFPSKNSNSNARPDTLEALSDEQLDRKSTRLNSSHLVISYAVFCLKKKIKAIPG